MIHHPITVYRHRFDLLLCFSLMLSTELDSTPNHIHLYHNGHFNNIYVGGKLYLVSEGSDGVLNTCHCWRLNEWKPATVTKKITW